MASRHSLLASVLVAACLWTACSVSILDPVGIYGSIEAAQACLQTAALQAVQNIFDNPANCLRLAFHDAFTYQNDTGEGGANGSVLFELGTGQFPLNTGLTACATFVPAALAATQQAGCPQITTADLIQVMGAMAVNVNGGPLCSILMGRPDAGQADDAADLPQQCQNATVLLEKFTSVGFRDPLKALVTLSGAHSIGHATAAPKTAQNCSQGNSFMTAQPTTFDNHYYNEVVNQVGKKGWFFSDRTLDDPTVAPSRMVSMMHLYAKSNDAFLGAWCKQYREMSLLGVDPSYAGFTVDDGWVLAPWFTNPPPPPPPSVPEEESPPPPRPPPPSPKTRPPPPKRVRSPPHGKKAATAKCPHSPPPPAAHVKEGSGKGATEAAKARAG